MSTILAIVNLNNGVIEKVTPAVETISVMQYDTREACLQGLAALIEEGFRIKSNVDGELVLVKRARSIGRPIQLHKNS